MIIVFFCQWSIRIFNTILIFKIRTFGVIHWPFFKQDLRLLHHSFFYFFYLENILFPRIFFILSSLRNISYPTGASCAFWIVEHLLYFKLTHPSFSFHFFFSLGFSFILLYLLSFKLLILYDTQPSYSRLRIVLTNLVSNLCYITVLCYICKWVIYLLQFLYVFTFTDVLPRFAIMLFELLCFTVG